MDGIVLNRGIPDLLELIHPFKDFIGTIAEVDDSCPNLETPFFLIAPLSTLLCRLQYRLEMVMGIIFQGRKRRPISFR